MRDIDCVMKQIYVFSRKITYLEDKQVDKYIDENFRISI